MKNRFLDRTTPPVLITLVIAAAANPVASNLFLPSLPGMADYFSADYAQMQLMVSLYLAATALLQLAIGPASDRFGRRPVMLFSFAVFIVSTAAAAFAPTIEFLLTCRVFQAFATAGMVLSRAIVRDTVQTDEAASRIGYITMGMSVAPMIGPMIGGVLDEFFGWKASFHMMLAFGITAFIIIYLDLGETHVQRSSSVSQQFKAYPELFRSRRFWGYSITAAFTSGIFFAFLGGGPFVASRILHLSPVVYGMYFGIISLGYSVGNFLTGRYSRRVGVNRMMFLGNAIAAAAMAVSILLFARGYYHPLSLFGPTFFVGIGAGSTLPNAFAGMVSVRPKLAGTAAGLGGSLQIGGGAALSVLAGAFLSPGSGPYPLLLVMFFSACGGLLTTLYVMRVARKAGEL